MSVVDYLFLVVCNVIHLENIFKVGRQVFSNTSSLYNYCYIYNYSTFKEKGGKEALPKSPKKMFHFSLSSC